MRVLFAIVLLAASAAAQSREMSAAEEESLSAALSEAGSSPVEFLRAIEKHLAKYPGSPRRADLERAAVKAAIEARDEKRIVLYGERVLARESDDLQTLERVTRLLLSSEDKERSARALKYAQRYEEVVREMMKESAPARAGAANWRDELDRGLGRALVFQARASFNLGRAADALALAEKAYDTYPNSESAREVARILDRTGKPLEAVAHYADAFSIPDARSTDAMRAHDRARMGELYRQAKGSETGLGDLILEAYDRIAVTIAARKLRLRANDPNAGLTRAMEFTLRGVDGGKLELASLNGKVVVFDFWATWCGPCRAQHPLYQQVKKRFQGRNEVVFLSVNTDEEAGLVKPFLEEHKWSGPVWFEDGLARALEISSIPTTLIIDRHGQVSSRMNGFVPTRFVEMLAERIEEALKN